MHRMCFVLSLCSPVSTVSPVLVIHVLMTLKGLGTCKALSEYVLACTEIWFCWFSYKSLDAYCLLGFSFNFNYLWVITWHNHSFYIVGSDKQLDWAELNTYDLVIMTSSSKKHGVATAAARVGKLDEVQRSMSTVPQEWGRGLQWRSCSYKQPSCHQLKWLKT